MKKKMLLQFLRIYLMLFMNLGRSNGNYVNDAELLQYRGIRRNGEPMKEATKFYHLSKRNQFLLLPLL